jgi:hypothetical protein
MYRFSRAIYRELADQILEDEHGGSPSNHERVLRACEAAVERLAFDRQHFARPARTLFRDIRIYLPMSAQDRAFRVIERTLAACDEFLARQPDQGVDPTGRPRQCRATTRRGEPCRRMPLLPHGYCPSHQHLAETEEAPATLAA